jgi:hypothetical protein
MGVGLGRLRDVQRGLLITGELLVEVADLRLGQKVLAWRQAAAIRRLPLPILRGNRRRLLPALLERGPERTATERMLTNRSSFRP